MDAIKKAIERFIAGVHSGLSYHDVKEFNERTDSYVKFLERLERKQEAGNVK